MNDPYPAGSQPSWENPSQHPDPATEPQFGLIDIVESFTAMRHESRNQARETRALADSLQQATSQIVTLERRLVAAAEHLQQVVESQQDDDRLKSMARTIAEIDHHVTRAVESVTRYGTSGARAQPESLKQSIRQRLKQLGPLARWFCKSLLQDLEQDVDRCFAAQPTTADPIVQGLEMLVDRLRRLMREQQIERIDCLGRPFDGKMMIAIEAIDAPSHARGDVAEQLTPAYTYRGAVIKYADVRVAR